MKTWTRRWKRPSSEVDRLQLRRRRHRWRSSTFPRWNGITMPLLARRLTEGEEEREEEEVAVPCLIQGSNETINREKRKKRIIKTRRVFAQKAIL